MICHFWHILLLRCRREQLSLKLPYLNWGLRSIRIRQRPSGLIAMWRELTSRKWTWIRHTLRGPDYCITRQALLSWNPQGSWQRRRLPNSWRRDTDHAIQSRDLSRHQLELLSRDRGDSIDFVSGLCSEMEWLKASDQIKTIAPNMKSL